MKLVFLLAFLFSSFLFAKEVKLQVLGSGGPELNDKRASSSYLIWIDGKSKVLIDFGSGASFRFEEVEAKIEDLEVLLFTHFHIDHSADLPALLKASYFTSREEDIPTLGPFSGKFVPNTDEFINRLFSNENGAWEYLGDYLDGTASFKIVPKTIEFSKKVKTVYKSKNLTVKAISVHHGPIPAIAYRVEVDGKVITFSGDMNGDYNTLEKLALNSDILVAHNAVPKGARGVAANLHMTPYKIGEIAKKAKVKNLILSHRMNRTLGEEKTTKEEIRKNYKNSMDFANDKDSYFIK